MKEGAIRVRGQKEVPMDTFEFLPCCELDSSLLLYPDSASLFIRASVSSHYYERAILNFRGMFGHWHWCDWS